ncbi:tannase/feruloyl esterase family alpha/beta hydrolase [Kineosporia rhizophila]|uniref:tannase/feruloyl esterase family alpha/beta hydrolase n=1 Tax=Kineosporia rhizophila TaxID=84633 RepID=UPI001E40F21D|nr:tannase/feruloyl esterase family alpha/beta hydrolase [Kineosporia rhizophila]MCE0537979.1 tannase/feruloyl esterase family alpha/beta hydrolase [Kineosporia rhizophila]
MDFRHHGTRITAAEVVSAGTLTNAGGPVGEHCRVTGRMNERVSPVDGQTYAIGFEMRLPLEWAGRFLYQANGGIDGQVAPAVGNFTGGQLRSGLQMGFAVLSSDAGHTGAQNPLFGLDPQARLDYGYQAVGSLTPMAKQLVRAAYGRGPDRSYIAGGSNGGRHTLVASARYADQYDGFFAVAPGFNLPLAALAQIWGAQQWATIAPDRGNLESALPMAQRRLLADSVLRTCDRLDGVRDGMVQAPGLCRSVFDVKRDVPTCPDCLTPAQKKVVQKVFDGARTSDGRRIYSPFHYDPGVATTGWADWKFRNSVSLDPVAHAFVFRTPPANPSVLQDTRGYALGLDVDAEFPRLFATQGVYTESAMSFMTPPDAAQLNTLRQRGAKMIVAHGVSDPVFSAMDTGRWYRELDRASRGRADAFVRYFEVPGMGHVRGGPATDQFDGLGALIRWVEGGQAPEKIVATARGAGNPGGTNPEVPATWAPDRTRPLCPYPSVARYRGGDVEKAASFACKRG